MNVDRSVQRVVLVAFLSLGMVPLTSPAAESAGAQIVGEVCSACHGVGLLGAPKIGDSSDWQSRFKKAGSLKVLAETAEHGKGNMPPRGGESTLSDSEIQSAIQYMLGKSGISP